MSCHNRGCTHAAEWVRVGTTDESCPLHLPVEVLENLTVLEDEGAFGGWTHADAAWVCAGSCDRFFDEEEERWSCSNCDEAACSECVVGGKCEVCRDAEEEKEMVQGIR